MVLYLRPTRHEVDEGAVVHVLECEFMQHLLHLFPILRTPFPAESHSAHVDSAAAVGHCREEAYTDLQIILIHLSFFRGATREGIVFRQARAVTSDASDPTNPAHTTAFMFRVL